MNLLDLLYESKEIKRLVVQRSIDYNIPLRYLCNEVGLEYDRFMQTYINSSSSRTAKISESQFIEILKILGIDVRYQIVVNKNADMELVSRNLAEKYKK